MTHLEKFDEYLNKVEETIGKAYEELVAHVKEQGGDIALNKTSDFIWLKDEGFVKVLKAKQCKRIRLAEYSWNGKLEVLFDGEDAEDEFAWVSLDWCSPAIEFNLYNIFDVLNQ